MVTLSVWLRVVLTLCVVAWVSGCASVRPDPSVADSPWVDARDNRWTHYTLPGKRPTNFHYERVDGRDAVAVRSDGSASMLRQPVLVAPDALGLLNFSWKVPSLIPGADMGRRDADDSPVRIMLAFDGDRSRLSARDAMLSELALALTGEEMPYATLMYVWCNQREPGSVIHSARTGRIRKLVLESGPQRLNHWLQYERDIRADYRRVFGEEPGALIGLAIMTDSDNTQSQARAWYGPVRLKPGTPVLSSGR